VLGVNWMQVRDWHNRRNAPTGFGGLTTAEVCAAASVTYRQIDFWVRCGYIPAVDRLASVGSGKPRRWTQDEATFVAQLGQLVRAGINVKIAATALREAATVGEVVKQVRLPGGLTVHLRPLLEAVSA
jgi:DNA-binding transcriptional MerR regulator